MRIMLKKLLALSLAAGLAVPAAAQTIRSYITCPDRSELFAQQKPPNFRPNGRKTETTS